MLFLLPPLCITSKGNFQMSASKPLHELSSAEQANFLLARGNFRCDGRVLQLMIDYQKQLMAILEDCAEQGSTPASQERFMEQVYYASETFAMINLATAHIYTEGHSKNFEVKKMIASILEAGLHSACCESMIEHCKSPDELLRLIREIRERANSFHLKMIAGRK